jgi:hypothetical protein
MGDALSGSTRRRVVIAVVVVLAALFLALALVTSTKSLPDLELHLSAPWLVLAVVGLLAFQPGLAELWRRLIRETGGELTVPRAQAIYNVSLLTRYVPTQILMAVTRIELANREGVKRPTSVASFAYEFALSVGSASALSVSFVIGLHSLRHQPLRYLVLLVPVALLLLLHPRVIAELESRVAKRLKVTSSPTAIPRAKLLLFVVAYLALWLEAGTAVYCLARGIHHVGSPTATALCSYAIGYAAAAAAFVVPAGLGARDAATATALATAMPFSVAIATAAIVRLVQTLIELFYAAATSLWARRCAPSPSEPPR